MLCIHKGSDYIIVKYCHALLLSPGFRLPLIFTPGIESVCLVIYYETLVFWLRGSVTGEVHDGPVVRWKSGFANDANLHLGRNLVREVCLICGDG